jgi:hypothetical protein
MLGRVLRFVVAVRRSAYLATFGGEEQGDKRAFQSRLACACRDPVGFSTCAAAAAPVAIPA